MYISITVFFIKFIFVLLLSIFLYSKRNDFAEAFSIGWLIAYNLQISLMLLLSCFNIMNRGAILTGLIWGVFLLLFLTRRKIVITLKLVCKEIEECSLLEWIMCFGAMLVCIYVMFHNSFFFDGTWDAHTYGMPRIELFTQKETLFVNMRSQALNIFCNEWNGELNGIFYRIMSETNQGIFWGNAENFFYGTIIVWWFCKKIGINNLGRHLGVLFYCGMPVVVFMAMTLKGDFLAIIFFLTSVAWLYDYFNTKSSFSLCILIVSLGLLTGSKISMVPFAGLCAISVLFDWITTVRNVASFWTNLKKISRALVVGIGAALISCFRYILNFIYYGNFFQRVETVDISVEHLKISAIELIKTMLLPDNIFSQFGNVNALNQDLGIVGIFFVLLMFPCALTGTVVCIKNIKKKNYTILFILFPIIGSLVFFMTSTYWFPWSFRYYAPWVCLAFFVILLSLQRIVEKSSEIIKKIVYTICIWIGIVSVYSTISLSTQFGEVTQGSWKEALNRTPIEREYAFHPYLLESYDGSEDVYDFFEEIKSGKKVLICNAIDSAVSYLFGENNGNDVTFCVPEELATEMASGNWDVISVSDIFITPEIEVLFDEGYMLYRPAKDIIAAHVYVSVK